MDAAKAGIQGIGKEKSLGLTILGLEPKLVS